MCACKLQVTLRKASDTATLTWLDTQAAALMRDKAALQKELEKYRPVSAGLCEGGGAGMIAPLFAE